jgi:HEAT repeat protein
MKKTATEALVNLLESPEIHALLVQITDADLEAKEQLLNILGGFGPVGAQALVELIKEGDDDTRRLAVHAIREGGPESQATLCKELTRYAPPEPTCRILEALPETGAVIAHAVSQTVVHPDEKVRGISLGLLKGLNHKTAADVLLHAARGDDAEAACMAVNSLAELAYPESIDGLCNFLKEPSNPVVQKAVCTALGKMGLAEAKPALQAVVKAKGFLGLRSAFSDEVRDEAKKSLELLAKGKGS